MNQCQDPHGIAGGFVYQTIVFVKYHFAGTGNLPRFARPGVFGQFGRRPAEDLVHPDGGIGIVAAISSHETGE